MQGTGFQSLVREDLTHTHTIEPMLHHKRSHCSESLSTAMNSSPHLLQLEKACEQQQKTQLS